MVQRLGSSLVKHKGETLDRIIDNNLQHSFSLSALASGARADRVTDNTALIQSIVDKFEDQHVYLTIEPNILWHFKKVTMKNGVNIIDMSGWDDEYAHWNEHIKYHFNHNAPDAQHNGNTFHILGRHHPALVVDNIGTKTDPEGEEHRASLIFRERGRLRARVGIGRSETDSNFIITDNKLRTRYSVATTNEGEFEMGFNSGPVSGVDYAYGTIRDADVIHRKYSSANRNIHEQYFVGGKNAVLVTYKVDGSIAYTQNGASTLNMSGKGEVTGLRKAVTYAASLSLSTARSGSVLLNHSSSASSGYTLPDSVGHSGLYYTFVNTTGAKITVTTRGTEAFIGGGTSKDVTTLGASLTVVSLGDGKWATM